MNKPNTFCRMQLSRGVFLMLFALGLILPVSAQAACSSFLGKVAINEYNYIDNFIELKVLDPTLTAGGANPFAGWKLAIWNKQGGNMTKAVEVDVSSNYTDSAKNTCRVSNNFIYVRNPFNPADMTNDTIVVLWETSGSKIVDLFRLGQSSLAAYPASINAGYGNYSQCPAIENALPNPAYDAPLIGSAGHKDIARLPDGTGPWTISPGTGANSLQTSCMSNDALLASLHHVRLDHSGSGVTCTGSSVTVNACDGPDSAGTCTANTGGLSGNVVARSAGGAVLATVPFTIAAGSSSTIVTVPVTSPQIVTLEASGLSVAANNPNTCWNGSTASCSHVYSDAGFIFDVPNHAAETLQTVSVSAVKKANNSLACTPAFANVAKNVTFACGYANPASGSQPVRVGGFALNAANSTAAACDAGGHTVGLSFNASGVASVAVQYADVGDMSLTATYTGSGADAGLVMTGSDTFIAAPASFAFSAIDTGPIKAGKPFGATVTAVNAAGNATPNFGKEVAAENAAITFSKCQPTGANAVSGAFSGSVGAFNSGAASAANLNWSEVGNGDLVATLASGSYLGSGLTATGNTGTGGMACNGAGNVGAFIPDHFTTTVSDGCAGCGFTYSGQPFTVVVTAMNGLATPGTTLNYDGTANTIPNFAHDVTLTDANAAATPAGKFGVSAAPMGVAVNAAGDKLTVPKADFTSGVATLTSVPKYTFNVTMAAPATIKLRATDVVYPAATSSGFTEGTTEIRSGRAKIGNANGSELLDLPMTATVQYYNGTNWLTSVTDSATSLAPALSNYQRKTGGAWTTAPLPASGSVIAGILSFRLSKPSGGGTGSVDVSISAPDYLLANSNGAGVNPSIAGRATFGVYKGKNEFIYLRENY